MTQAEQASMKDPAGQVAELTTNTVETTRGNWMRRMRYLYSDTSPPSAMFNAIHIPTGTLVWRLDSTCLAVEAP